MLKNYYAKCTCNTPCNCKSLCQKVDEKLLSEEDRINFLKEIGVNDSSIIDNNKFDKYLKNVRKKFECPEQMFEETSKFIGNYELLKNSFGKNYFSLGTNAEGGESSILPKHQKIKETYIYKMMKEIERGIPDLENLNKSHVSEEIKKRIIAVGCLRSLLYLKIFEDYVVELAFIYDIQKEAYRFKNIFHRLKTDIYNPPGTKNLQGYSNDSHPHGGWRASTYTPLSIIGHNPQVANHLEYFGAVTIKFGNEGDDSARKKRTLTREAIKENINALLFTQYENAFEFCFNTDCNKKNELINIFLDSIDTQKISGCAAAKIQEGLLKLQAQKFVSERYEDLAANNKYLINMQKEIFKYDNSFEDLFNEEKHEIKILLNKFIGSLEGNNISYEFEYTVNDENILKIFAFIRQSLISSNAIKSDHYKNFVFSLEKEEIVSIYKDFLKKENSKKEEPLKSSQEIEFSSIHDNFAKKIIAVTDQPSKLLMKHFELLAQYKDFNIKFKFLEKANNLEANYFLIGHKLNDSFFTNIHDNYNTIAEAKADVEAEIEAEAKADAKARKLKLILIIILFITVFAVVATILHPSLISLAF